METEEEKATQLKVIRTWENPGKGNYYDNILCELIKADGVEHIIGTTVIVAGKKK